MGALAGLAMGSRADKDNLKASEFFSEAFVNVLDCFLPIQFRCHKGNWSDNGRGAAGIRQSGCEGVAERFY